MLCFPSSLYVTIILSSSLCTKNRMTSQDQSIGFAGPQHPLAGPWPRAVHSKSDPEARSDVCALARAVQRRHIQGKPQIIIRGRYARGVVKSSSCWAHPPACYGRILSSRMCLLELHNDDTDTFQPLSYLSSQVGCISSTDTLL